MAGSVYTYAGNSQKGNLTGAITTSQGRVALGKSGLFLSSEYSSLVGQGFLLVPGPAQSPAAQLNAPGVVVNGNGVLTGGYRYVFTFVTANGETTAGPESVVVNPSAQAVAVSQIPVATALSGVIARKIYRTVANGAAGSELLLATINDNVTTTFTDNVPDSSLGAAPPTADGSSVIGGPVAQIASYELQSNRDVPFGYPSLDVNGDLNPAEFPPGLVLAIALSNAALQSLPIRATATTSIAATAGSHNPYDATSAALTAALPTGVSKGALISLEKYDSGSNTVTITGSIRGVASSSLMLLLAHEQVLLETDANGSWWPIGGHKTLASLDVHNIALINQQLASNPTVVAAAASAVAAAIAGVNALAAITIPDPNYSFCIVDANGERSWLEFDKAGHPTTNSISLIYNMINAQTTAAAMTAMGTSERGSGYPVSFAIVDANGKESWIQIGLDGHITPFTASAISTAINFPTGSFYPQTFAVVDANGSIGDLELDQTGHISARVMALWKARLAIINPIASICVVGDSYSTWTQYQSGLTTETGLAVDGTQALGGRTSTEIGIYQGGIHPIFTVAGNQIPASGAVNLTMIAPINTYNTAYSGAATVPWYYHGKLGGVPGNLVQDPQWSSSPSQPSQWQFIRDTAGAAVNLTAGVSAEFVPDNASSTYKNYINVFWPGRNDVYTWVNSVGDPAGSSSPAASAFPYYPYQNAIPEVDSRRVLLRDILSMIQNVNQPQRFIVVGVCNAPFRQEYWGGTSQTDYQTIVYYNQMMADRLGPQFFDARRYLIDTGLSALGLTPTSQDTIDIGNDMVPTQLHQSDLLHLSNGAFGLVGQQVGYRIKQLGWA